MKLFKKDKPRLAKNPQGVQAIGLGHKISKGKDTGRMAICYFVKEKLPKEQLGDNCIPKEINGFETDIIETGGEIEPLYKTKHRPIQGGISGKVEGGTACSIGIPCYRNGVRGVITNEHCVMYPSGTNNVGKRFLQPSPNDGGKVTDAIGLVTDAPTIKNNKVNKKDSVFIPTFVPVEDSVLGFDYKPKAIEPKIGMPFTKIGRTTGKTEGIISHINVTALINYKGDLGVCEFFPCIFALQNNYNIVDGGDSGSCIYNEDGVIGQTFAAGPNLAIFLPISSVIEELGITLEEPKLYVAAGKEWYVELGTETKTMVNLNLRTEPRVHPSTFIRTLPVGTELKVINYAGKSGGYEWLEVELKS
jgi:hypothetical protein